MVKFWSVADTVCLGPNAGSHSWWLRSHPSQIYSQQRMCESQPISRPIITFIRDQELPNLEPWDLGLHGIFQRNKKTLPFLGKVQNRDGSGFWKPSERMSLLAFLYGDFVWFVTLPRNSGWNQLETCKISNPILAVKPLSHYKLDLQCSKLTGNLKHLCHQFALTVLEG